MNQPRPRGGARPGAGRRPTIAGAKRRNIVITDEDWARAQALGDGNASAGIAAALASAQRKG